MATTSSYQNAKGSQFVPTANTWGGEAKQVLQAAALNKTKEDQAHTMAEDSTWKAVEDSWVLAPGQTWEEKVEEEHQAALKRSLCPPTLKDLQRLSSPDKDVPLSGSSYGTPVDDMRRRQKAARTGCPKLPKPFATRAPFFWSTACDGLVGVDGVWDFRMIKYVYRCTPENIHECFEPSWNPRRMPPVDVVIALITEKERRRFRAAIKREIGQWFKNLEGSNPTRLASSYQTTQNTSPMLYLPTNDSQSRYSARPASPVIDDDASHIQYQYFTVTHPNQAEQVESSSFVQKETPDMQVITQTTPQLVPAVFLPSYQSSGFLSRTGPGEDVGPAKGNRNRSRQDSAIGDLESQIRAWQPVGPDPSTLPNPRFWDKSKAQTSSHRPKMHNGLGLNDSTRAQEVVQRQPQSHNAVPAMSYHPQARQTLSASANIYQPVQAQGSPSNGQNSGGLSEMSLSQQDLEMLILEEKRAARFEGRPERKLLGNGKFVPKPPRPEGGPQKVRGLPRDVHHSKRR